MNTVLFVGLLLFAFVSLYIVLQRFLQKNEAVALEMYTTDKLHRIKRWFCKMKIKFIRYDRSKKNQYVDEQTRQNIVRYGHTLSDSNGEMLTRTAMVQMQVDLLFDRLNTLKKSVSSKLQYTNPVGRLLAEDIAELLAIRESLNQLGSPITRSTGRRWLNSYFSDTAGPASCRVAAEAPADRPAFEEWRKEIVSQLI